MPRLARIALLRCKTLLLKDARRRSSLPDSAT